MNTNKILKNLSDKYNKDVRVIDLVTKHPFKFTRDVMADPEDNRPVRLMYFGVFVQKNSKNKGKYYDTIHLNYIKDLMRL